MKKHFVHQKIIKSMEKGRKKIQNKKKNVHLLEPVFNVNN